MKDNWKRKQPVEYLEETLSRNCKEKKARRFGGRGVKRAESRSGGLRSGITLRSTLKSTPATAAAEGGDNI